MAFVDASMQAAAGAGLSRIFTYQTPDTIATTITSGYFNNKFAELKQFDIIIVISETGGTAKIDVIFISSTTGATTVTTSAVEGIVTT